MVFNESEAVQAGLLIYERELAPSVKLANVWLSSLPSIRLLGGLFVESAKGAGDLNYNNSVVTYSQKKE